MASMTAASARVVAPAFTSGSIRSSSSSFVANPLLSTPRVGLRLRCTARHTAFFKLGGQSAESAGIFASQGREDYSADDVAHYFNYSGMLASEGTYDKMEQLLATGTHAVDILLLLAASEGDRRKIEELIRAGARCDVKDLDGRTALDRASDDEIREYIEQGCLSGV